MAEEMFQFWAETQNFAKTGKHFKVSQTVVYRLRKENKWEKRYKEKVRSKLREKAEKNAVKNILSNLELIREVKNRVVEKILEALKPDAKEKLPLPTIDQFCRLVQVEEELLNGPTAGPVTINQFGPNLTLLRINEAKTPKEIQERYIELADRIIETGEIEAKRARLNANGNPRSEGGS